MQICKIIPFLFIATVGFSQQRNVNYFVEKAVLNAAVIADLNNQASANTLDSLIYRATLKPQIALNLMSNYAPVINSYGFDQAITNGQNVSGLVGFSKRIIGSDQRNNQLEAISLLNKKRYTTKKITITDIKKAVQSQYILAYSDRKQIEFLVNQSNLLTVELDLLKKLTQKSVYKQTDYLLFLSTVKQQELIRLQMEQQFENDLAVLNYLSGTDEKATIELKKPEIEITSNIDATHTLFSQQFKIDSLSIQNQRMNIANNYKPVVSLLADAGYLSSFPSQAYKNFGVSVGFNVSIPLYDGEQRKLLIGKNDLAQKTNLAYKKQFNLQYDQQRQQLLTKISRNEVLLKQLEEQHKINETLISAFNKLLVSGNAVVTDYVLAMANSITLNNAVAQNRMNRLLLINELNYWNTNEK